MQDDATTLYLNGLAELAAHSFLSTHGAIEAILQLLVEQLGMRSSFLARITREASRHEVLAAHNLPGGCAIVAGDVLDLSRTF